MTKEENEKRIREVTNDLCGLSDRPRKVIWATSLGPMIIASEIRLRRNHNFPWLYGGTARDVPSFEVPQAALREIQRQPKWIKRGVDLFNKLGTNTPACEHEAARITSLRPEYFATQNAIFYPHNRVIWACPKPIISKKNSSGWYHCENGPALAWEDGFELYFINGVSVPKWLVVNPEKLKAEDIITQRNAEVVRIMLEKMSPDGFIKATNATVVDEDIVPSKTTKKDGSKLKVVSFKDHRKLLSIPAPKLPDKMIKLVLVECPSTGHKALLGVPPRMTTVASAVNWIEHPTQGNNAYEMVLET